QRIVANGSDFHIFTTDWNSATSAYDLRYTRSQDHAATWQPPVVLVTGMTGLYAGLAWAKATDSAVFVVWAQGNALPLQWGLLSSFDQGSTWQSQNPPAWTSPVFASVGPILYAAWSTPSGIVANRSLDAGATWLPTDVNLTPTLPAGATVGSP